MGFYKELQHLLHLIFSTSSTITIGSGAPSFTYWDHKSDLSLIDEVKIYDKALTETEVKNTMK